MRNVWIIARREYKLYFATPIAYVVAGLIMLVVGYLFFANIVVSTQQPGQFTPGVGVVINPLSFLLVFAIPAITMRLLSEEQRHGTIELLLTAPVRDAEVVVGKWLGALLFVATIIGLTWIYPIMLNNLVDPGIDQGPLVTGYLGVFLISSGFIAVGVAISSFFSNQVASFVATMGATLALWWIFGIPAQVAAGSRVAEVFGYLSFNSHFGNSLLGGVINLDDIVYFLSVTAFALLVGTVSLETRRWR